MNFKATIFFAYLSLSAYLNGMLIKKFHIVWFAFINPNANETLAFISFFVALIFFFSFISSFQRVLRKSKGQNKLENLTISLMNSFRLFLFSGIASVVLIAIGVISNIIIPPSSGKNITIGLITIITFTAMYFFLVSFINYLAIKISQRTKSYTVSQP